MEPDYQRLWERAKRTFGDRTPPEAIETTRQIIGPGVIPNSEKAAQAAMQKLKNGDIPTSDEVIALEFVIRIMRPAPLVVNGLLEGIDSGGNLHPPTTVKRWNEFCSVAQPWLASVARIDHSALGHIGTGFVVRGDVLATNRHVLDLLTGGSGLLKSGSALARFRCEWKAQEPPETKSALLGVLRVHKRLDIALLTIEANKPRAPLLLDATTTVQDGHPVAVVGFPAEAGLKPLFADAIFGTKYGVKRGALGEIMTPEVPMLFHDCSTLGGNSGSPIFSLISNRVIGIHSSGWFAYRNEALVAQEIQTMLSN